MPNISVSFLGKTENVLNLRKSLLNEFDEFSSNEDNYRRVIPFYEDEKLVGNKICVGLINHYCGKNYSVYMNYQNSFDIKNKRLSGKGAKLNLVLNAKKNVVLETLVERVKTLSSLDKF